MWHEQRMLCLTILCVLCGASASAAGQQRFVDVALVDKTAPGSPFEVNGQVSLQETVSGNQVETSWAERVVAKNISSKRILLLVSSLTLIGRHSRGALRGPGDGPTYVLSDDRFFTKDVIQPSESLVLRDAQPEKALIECCVSPLERGSEPRAEFQIRFVQFVDGSSFGDPADAKADLELRGMIFTGLRNLVLSYSEHGEPGFRRNTTAGTVVRIIALCRHTHQLRRKRNYGGRHSR